MDALLENGSALFMVLGVLFSLLIGAIVLIIFTRLELFRVKNDYNSLLQYLGGSESRNILRDLASSLRGIEHDNRFRDHDVSQLHASVTSCIQKVAVVRYNAFQNVGSDQSFSIAMLDSDDNGFVLSGIFGRDSSTTYAKPLIAGVSDYVLTEEEENAIGLARKRYIDMSRTK